MGRVVGISSPGFERRRMWAGMTRPVHMQLRQSDRGAVVHTSARVSPNGPLFGTSCGWVSSGLQLAGRHPGNGMEALLGGKGQIGSSVPGVPCVHSDAGGRKSTETMDRGEPALTKELGRCESDTERHRRVQGSRP